MKRSPRTRRPRTARRKARRSGTNPEWASANQAITLSQDSMNIVYRMDDINLAVFDRLANIAKSYQYYRFNKVDVIFTPLQDTFTDSNVQSVPYIYKLLMKGDALDAGTFNKLRDAGCKPIRFDDKTIKISFKPFVQNAVIQQDSVGGAPVLPAWALSKASPWLATSYAPQDQNLTWTPSTVPHKGLLYGVEQQNSTSTHYYVVTIVAHAQFKKPLTFATVGDPGSTQKVIRDREDPLP